MILFSITLLDTFKLTHFLPNIVLNINLNFRLNSALGWCGEPEAFTYVTVDLGSIHRVKAIVVKVRVTNFRQHRQQFYHHPLVRLSRNQDFTS